MQQEVSSQFLPPSLQETQEEVSPQFLPPSSQEIPFCHRCEIEVSVSVFCSPSPDAVRLAFILNGGERRLVFISVKEAQQLAKSFSLALNGSAHEKSVPFVSKSAYTGRMINIFVDEETVPTFRMTLEEAIRFEKELTARVGIPDGNSWTTPTQEFPRTRKQEQQDDNSWTIEEFLRTRKQEQQDDNSWTIALVALFLAIPFIILFAKTILYFLVGLLVAILLFLLARSGLLWPLMQIAGVVLLAMGLFWWQIIKMIFEDCVKFDHKN